MIFNYPLILISAFFLIFVFKRKILLLLFAFTTSFNFLVLFKFGGTRFTVMHYVAILILFHYSFIRKRGRNARKLLQERLLIYWVVIIIISLIMPIILKHKIAVVPLSIADFQEYNSSVPLCFTMSNITQIFYPLFMVTITIIVSRLITNVYELRLFIKWFIYGVVIVIFSGFLIQFGLMFKGAEFIAKLFFFFTGESDIKDVLARTMNYNVFAQIPRMYSLAGEPSFTSFLLIAALPFTVSGDDFLLSKKIRIFVIVLIFFALFLSGSTTAYVGIILFSFFNIFYKLVLKRDFTVILGIIFITLILILAYFLLFYFNSNLVLAITDYFFNNHILKLVSLAGSAKIRFETILVSWDVFMKSPLLGVGYGSHRSAAMIMSLLSNIGILGTFLFLLFNISIIQECLKIDIKSDMLTISKSFLTSISSILPIMLFAIPITAINFGWYWLVLVIGLVFVRINYHY